MNLISILKKIGKDLSHVGGWIDDGLKIAAPIISVVDPPLGPIIIAIENVFNNLPTTTSLTPEFVQQIITAITLIEQTKVLTKT